MEVSRLGVESELQLPPYATAMAMQDLSHVCELYHSLGQGRFLNPLSEARDRTHVYMNLGFVTTEPQSELVSFYFLSL